MPFAAGRPSGAGFGIPPTAFLSFAGTLVPIFATIIAAFITTAADKEYGAATAFNPKALTIYAPSLPFHARRAADLALEPDLIGIIAAAILAIVVVGFASDGLLSGSKCGNYE
jgi:hypothetical protein